MIDPFRILKGCQTEKIPIKDLIGITDEIWIWALGSEPDDNVELMFSFLVSIKRVRCAVESKAHPSSAFLLSFPSHGPDVFLRTKWTIFNSQPRQFRAGESPQSAYSKMHRTPSGCFWSPADLPSLYKELWQIFHTRPSSTCPGSEKPHSNSFPVTLSSHTIHEGHSIVSTLPTTCACAHTHAHTRASILLLKG